MVSKRNALIIFISAFALLSLGAFFSLSDWGNVTTDNAYVSGDPVVVTAPTAGTVASVAVTDTQEVTAGQELVMLDIFDLQRVEREARLELQASLVALQQAKRLIDARRLDETGSERARTIASLEYDSAVADRVRAQQELDRVRELRKGGWVSERNLLESESAARLSQLNVERKEEEVRRASNEVDGSRITTALQRDDVARLQASVDAARARLEIAEANVRRSSIQAPVDGIIAERRVNPGQQVAEGSVLMQIVPLSELYVDANFKEDQLADISIGDTAVLTSDFYGQSVTYSGKVVGLSGGTGAAFSPIPTVNASGNWIKTTQRLPVRIELDRAELKKHPLRLGLSMSVSIRKR